MTRARARVNCTVAVVVVVVDNARGKPETDRRGARDDVALRFAICLATLVSRGNRGRLLRNGDCCLYAIERERGECEKGETRFASVTRREAASDSRAIALSPPPDGASAQREAQLQSRVALNAEIY